MYLEYEKEIEQLLDRMSLEEKIGQMNQVKWPDTDELFESYKEKIARGEIGSIILTGSATSGNEDYHCLNV